ncbi:MAG TPA: double-CXXCG motif protein [Myxococcus sp.]|nr:double-CXXCG motif protein [Myxococcus sp.]
MTCYFELQRSAQPQWSGVCRAERRWSLPGLEECPGCRATWSGVLEYPAVDVSELEEAHELEEARPEPFAEFARLRERVRPYCPPNAPLEPGTGFGPLEGTARGKWGPITLTDPWTVLVREDALRALAALHGIVPVWPRFRRAPMPRVAELQLLPRGRLHPDCLPPDWPSPCAMCGRKEAVLPTHYWVDLASLKDAPDAFRLGDAVTRIIVSERFAEVISRLDPSDVVLTPIPTSRPPDGKPQPPGCIPFRPG